jgi:hypothetical protein
MTWSRQVAPKRTDQPLRVWVLPRRSRRRHDLLDAEALDRLPEALAIDVVAIPQHESRRCLLRESLDHLPSRPLRRRVRRDVEVHHPPPVVREDEEAKQDP